MGKILAVASGKGGVGKSTVVCGLGAALAKSGKTVLLADCDSGLRCLDLMLSTSKDSAFNLADAVNGGASVSQCAVECEKLRGLFVLSAAYHPGALEETEKFKKAMREAAENYDYILLDCPAGIGREFESAVKASDGVFTVATPEPVSVRDAGTAARAAEKLSGVPARLIINRLDLGLVKKGIYFNADKIIDGVCARLIGVVPEDEKAHRSTVTGVPILSGRAAKAFCRIAGRVNGQKIAIPKPRKI